MEDQASNKETYEGGILRKPLFDNLIKYLPLLGLTMAVIGLIDSILYYGRFDVNIISYLDVSEIIFLASDRIIIDSLAVISFLAGFVQVIPLIVSRVQKIDKNIRVYSALIVVVVVITLINSLDFFIPFRNFSETSYDLIKIAFYLLSILLIVSTLIGVVSRDFILMISFLILSFQFFNGKASIRKTNIEEQGGKYSVSLTLMNGEEVQTNKTFVYIGRTKNYYFFRWLKPLNKTVVIPVSNIRQERITQLRENV